MPSFRAGRQCRRLCQLQNLGCLAVGLHGWWRPPGAEESALWTHSTSPVRRGTADAEPDKALFSLGDNDGLVFGPLGGRQPAHPHTLMEADTLKASPGLGRGPQWSPNHTHGIAECLSVAWDWIPTCGVELPPPVGGKTRLTWGNRQGYKGPREKLAGIYSPK